MTNVDRIETSRKQSAVGPRLVTVIILTFNSKESLRQVVESCQSLSNRVLVVDSYSTDGTVELATELGCELVQHSFDNYSAQRQWAQKYADLDPEDWVLHLDSDEVLSPELRDSIAAALTPGTINIDGFLVRRLSYFLGHPIRHGFINPSWHLRLFRAGKGGCEDRLYDQHYVVDGPTGSLRGLLLDLQITTIDKWTSSHNRWATAEAMEFLKMGAIAQTEGETGRVLKGSLTGDIRMKKRWLKNQIWYKTPLFVRPFLFFLYSYIFRLGFLDGKPGLVYHVLQAFWFRFLVDAKIYEMRLQEKNRPVNPK
ncbi:MAG: glycosyltransferase family 2 protein [Capsulimonadaceae bacterium]